MTSPISNTTYPNCPPRVLVFDSGVGGLSVAREIQRRMPGLSLIYASDNGFFPYGTKGEEELITRVDKVIGKLLANYPVDILVIACNTASTLTLPHLRSRLRLPIVGVVPAIKPAAGLTRTGVIGLLATPATVARPYTHELIREYATGCEVLSIGSSELVQLAECKLRGESIDQTVITSLVSQFTQKDHFSRMDVMILACTHFPLLKEELRENLPGHIQLIDSGEAIARRVEFLLDGSKNSIEEAFNGSSPQHLAVFTEETQEARQLVSALASFGIHQIHFLDMQ